MAVEDTPCADVERAGDVILHVLAGGVHQGLLTLFDIGQPDTGIQIDVRFIPVEDFFFGTGPSQQSLNVFKGFAPSSHRDAQGGTGTAAPAFLFSKHLAYPRRRQVNACIVTQLQRKQFQRPPRALPAVVFRGRPHVLQKTFANCWRHFPRPAFSSFVPKPVEPFLFQTIHRRVHRRPDAADFLLHRLDRMALSQQQCNTAPLCFDSALRFAHHRHHRHHFITLRTRQLNTYLHLEKPPGLNDLLDKTSINPSGFSSYI